MWSCKSGMIAALQMNKNWRVFFLTLSCCVLFVPLGKNCFLHSHGSSMCPFQLTPCASGAVVKIDVWDPPARDPGMLWGTRGLGERLKLPPWRRLRLGLQVWSCPPCFAQGSTCAACPRTRWPSPLWPSCLTPSSIPSLSVWNHFWECSRHNSSLGALLCRRKGGCFFTGCCCLVPAGCCHGNGPSNCSQAGGLWFASSPPPRSCSWLYHLAF